ncbi:unnamed protein product, partial [Mesorhabditis belari]|uniref:Uncharacterized protein n=1 Tax=Mesorhabditis belari TaxID=2138241 RepID=A0AAF3EH53_9BILA
MRFAILFCVLLVSSVFGFSPRHKRSSSSSSSSEEHHGLLMTEAVDPLAAQMPSVGASPPIGTQPVQNGGPVYPSGVPNSVPSVTLGR